MQYIWYWFWVFFLLLLLILLLPYWPYSRGSRWGYYPSILVGIVIIIFSLFLLLAAI